MSEEHEDTVITPKHFVYGRDIDRNQSVQHEFHELFGDDMRKRQAYCQVYLNILQNDLLKNIYSPYRRHIPSRVIKTIVLLVV